MDIPTLLRLYRFNRSYARALISDVTDDMATTTPGLGLENHPVFVIGHLCTGAAMISAELGGAGELPDGWRDLFQRGGPVDQRLPGEGIPWPALSEVMSELDRLHDEVETGVRAIPKEKWAEPSSWRLSVHLPTLADLTWFMCVVHESIHLGQVASWRRAMGLESAMARL